ncbi:LuxR C-terminal-related transcriptional regulator [Flaviflexus equikiangi]|uniref:HTH luxR-type domain-containing protein n=1 Tax=Flaviflexus equikiangi TaxID=2758573 RepID=A0ABS2THK2_9ACTO|nr:LuxR C-terminal-related transcriptional regulator [Flaviflexus equikiangi]MBM9434136.1 hypothetical protein [Flaviflexus equikiangi]
MSDERRCLAAVRPKAPQTDGWPSRHSREYCPDREREILLLVARGLSNNEIAASLVILAYETGLLIPGR